jgi:sugar lactone lactonase YvrE
MTDVSEKPKINVLLNGVAFGESPRWRGERLWFADWGAKEIVAVDANGSREVMVQVNFPSFPMSFDWLPDGRLLVVSARDGLLLRREPDGSLTTHADLSGLAPKGRPWNEIVADGRGNVYINNTGFEFPGGDFATGSIALLTADGSVRQVADGVAFPNGMAVTADNATLIVAESYGQRLTAFEIAADGGLSNRRIWAQTGQDHPDGICLNAEGAVWYADVGGKRCVRVCEGGEVLQAIDVDRGCFACVLGGADRKTLFILATEWRGVGHDITGGARSGQVLTFEAPARGAGWP